MKEASFVQTRTGPKATQPESHQKNSSSRSIINNNKLAELAKSTRIEKGEPQRTSKDTRPKEVERTNIVTPKPMAKVPAMEEEQTANSATVLPQVEMPRKEGPAYKSQAPVEEGVDLDAITESILDLPITLPLRNAAGLAPQIRERIRAQFSRTRKAREKKVLFEGVVEEENEEDETDDDGPIHIAKIPFPNYCIAQEGDGGSAPLGSAVAGDPVLTYLSEIADDKPRELYVAKELHALRSVYPRINGVGQEEAILDDGSQIVSMAEKVAIELGLTWDPGVTLGVESANRQVERSLGLARNVAFNFGGVVLYLQVHIIRNPAYRVLLGRPFSVFGVTSIRNYADGKQTVVVTDPNTEKQAVLPTYERGRTPEELQKEKHDSAFQSASMT